MLFFQLINTRHEKVPTVLTSNTGFEEWGGGLGSEVMATALIDRLVHHRHILNIRGNCYRMREHQNSLEPGSDRQLNARPQLAIPRAAKTLNRDLATNFEIEGKDSNRTSRRGQIFVAMHHRCVRYHTHLQIYTSRPESSAPTIGIEGVKRPIPPAGNCDPPGLP